jgi:hypothetical protein
MMSNAQFEIMTNLQYVNRDQKRRLREFETGAKYVSVKAEHQKQLAEKDKEIKGLKLSLAEANSATVTARNYWLQVIEDMEKEHTKELRANDKRIKELGERSLKYERRVDELKASLVEIRRELYAVKGEFEDEKEKSHRLVAQLNRDHENSSIPSSLKPNRKKITNSREKSSKKQGAQPGHKGHRRKRHEPANIINIPPPEEYTDNPNFSPTGKIIVKQAVNIAVSVIVDEYRTPEFRHKITRQRMHADFPDGVVNDVNYGGSIKGFSFLLNNYCCVSIDKTREFLYELTGGKLEISRGMINGLSKEFSKKTRAEQADVFLNLLHAPVMGADFTSVRVNGESAQVLVCATGGVSMYYAREQKGHEGVKDSPVEHFQGTLIHDHDKTFYSYGRLHQECLAHILRYLLSSIENEPGLAWNKQMRELIREMIHYRNALDDDTGININIVQGLESRYLEILETAKKEYEYEPPSKYYKDGYNLYRRRYEYKDSHLLFLYDKSVPANNNLCERLLRIIKRKLKQIMTFRSFDSLDYLCTSLGLLAIFRTQNENLYASVASIFA